MTKGWIAVQMLHRALRRLIGARTVRDLYDENGVLLIRAETTLTAEHLRILEKHGVFPNDEEVTGIGPYAGAESFAHEALINDTVLQVRQLFEEVRNERKIPLADLRMHILPVIREVSLDPNLIGLFATLQARDDYLYRHPLAVAIISHILGSWLGIDRQELLQLTTAALLHDVGKMFIPPDMLHKTDRLTEEEYALLKQHTVFGYKLLDATVGASHRQALVALQHHERMDGSGYPFGLTNDRIDGFSRIVAVADVFHKMTAGRGYRNASPFYEVLFHMEKEMFGKLDPTVTRVLIEKMMQLLIGQTVRLTDGSEGTIVMVHAHAPTRPLVQAGGRFVDLSKDYTLHILQILPSDG